MKRIGISVILWGALLVGLPAAVADETPPPDGMDVTLLEDGSLRISWDAISGSVDYRVYRNGEPIVTVAETEFIDFNPPPAVAYQVATVSGEAESDPSDPLIVANAGTDMEALDFQATPSLQSSMIKADTFEGSYPPGCTLVLIGIYTSPPFVAVHVNQRCLESWLDP